MSAVTQFRGVNPWRQTYWDVRAVGNFVGGGTGTGFLLATAVAALSGTPFRLLALGALGCIGLGLLCVWMEIGRPWRAWNVFFNARTSWMTREALVAPPLMAVGFAAAVFGSVTLLAAAALLALVFLYCQARILRASMGIPAWRAPQIVPLIYSTGLTEGLGVFLAAAAVVLGGAGAWAGVALLVLLAARFLAWRAYVAPLRAGGAPRPAVKALEAGERLFLLAGHAVPAVLALVALALPGALQAVCFALAGLAAAAAGWRLKYTIIVDAAFTQGYSVERTPSRGRGGSMPGGKPGW